MAAHPVGPTDYMRAEIGTARLLDASPVVAGAFAELVLVYTAGRFGIDDTGGILVTFRFASDLGTPQFSDPAAAHFVTAVASNGAELTLGWDVKGHLRPWDKALRVKVVRGFLRAGETITLRLGDRGGGSPGLRMQTFCEAPFVLRTLADPFATLNWCEVPEHPEIAIVPGPPAAWRAVLPTLAAPGATFALGLRADDVWGNPTDQVSGALTLHAVGGDIAGLPPAVRFAPGARAHRIEGLSVAEPGEVAVELRRNGVVVAVSNPLRVAASPLGHAWADLHGQSGETIGTGTARELAEFARDRAFLEVMCHQGNDFQITAAFWAELNALTAELETPGRFVFLPGYEWSGNTALGGDRNVLFLREGETIHRSSHALVGDLADAATDAFDAAALFERLRSRDAVVLAHVGGRYADISGRFHDRALQRSVEIHSDWGTFEWLADDAFRDGLRVGIVANSDGHKGRHGASHPGASLFGAFGGLTCLLVPRLDRAAVFEALRRRRHYATTGCRLFVDARVTLTAAGALHHDDPALGGAPVGMADAALMGDIVVGGGAAALQLDVAAAAPIERIEFRDGSDVLEVWRPQAGAAPGQRLRVLWEGAEYRGRGRQTIWDGEATLVGNTFAAITPINRWNLDRRCERVAPDRVAWSAVTTGGFAGFEARLAGAGDAGTLCVTTPHGRLEAPLAALGAAGVAVDCGGLGRRLFAQRLPDAESPRAVRLTRALPRRARGDTALWVKIVLEDGNAAWSSPIYLVP